jgi:hypothetical protein
VTNPTNSYIDGQNLLVQTTDCVNKWTFPVALYPRKSKTFTVSYTLDKCSFATSTGLESSIETTMNYGPLVSVTIDPLAHRAALCDTRDNMPGKTPKAPKVPKA